MARVLKAWPCVASALLYLLAFPPVNLALVLFVALVPWLISLKDATPSGAFRSGYTMGFVIVIAEMSFVQPLVTHWTGSPALGFLPLVICGFLGAFYFAVLGWIIRGLWLRNWFWAIPLVWAGMEVFRSYIPGLSFPFFLIATPLWPFPALIGVAYWGTVYFVSAWVCLINVLVALAFDGRRRDIRPYAAPAALILILSLVRYQTPISGEKMRVTIGQPGVDMAFGDEATRARKLLSNTNFLMDVAVAAKSDLLVLPEGMLDTGDSMPPLTPFTIPKGLNVVLGARRGNGPFYQSAYAFDGQWKFVDKTRLVVFGEYVPGRNWLPFLDSFHLASGDLVPGEKTQSIQVGSINVGPLLCFEALFFDVAQQQSMNGAQLLAIMSDDDWYMGTPAPDQLKSGAIWRAVETGLPVARSAGLGYSMVVDQRGNVLWQIPIGANTAATKLVQIDKHPDKLPWRPVFPWLAGISLFAIPPLLRFTAKKAPASAGSP